jgi:EAL domain-containing protein (putative c-di-GMP-specific phosphodiesterase class I)
MNLLPQGRAADDLLRVLDVLEDPTGIEIAVQPIVELATGRAAGHEALSRFTHGPATGPDTWFARAHRCGLGAKLEAKAIAAALALPGRRPSDWLAINLSPSSLFSPHVLDVLAGDLSGLIIEITENEPLYGHGEQLAALSDLRARGARIALDDLGAGFACDPQVALIRPDLVKLDRRIVTGVATDERKRARVAAFVRSADAVGAAICAEGVESLDDIEYLARLGVTYAQGYAIARPGPAWTTVASAAAAVCKATAVPDLMAALTRGPMCSTGRSTRRENAGRFSYRPSPSLDGGEERIHDARGCRT